MLAVNLFHMRRGRVVDRREFFWEDLPELEICATGEIEEGSEISGEDRGEGGVAAEVSTISGSAQGPASFSPGEFFSSLLKQLYIGQPYVPRNIYVPVEFEDREELQDLLSEQIAADGARSARVHIMVPQRGEKRSLIDLAGNNAKQSYDQRFRVMKPNMRAIQEALQEALGLAELPRRIE